MRFKVGAFDTTQKLEAYLNSQENAIYDLVGFGELHDFKSKLTVIMELQEDRRKSGVDSSPSD